jgi:hypothetical protein
MTNKEKAKFIAEKQGWVFEPSGTDSRFDIAINQNLKESIFADFAISRYTSFNGLMPIVVEINMAAEYSIVVDIAKVSYFQGTNIIDSFWFKTDLGLIDALQSAIIKYYEDSK